MTDSKADKVKQEMENSNSDTTMREEMNTVLPGSEPLENLSAEQTGPVHYTVTSARNGNVSQHRVNIKDRWCTCEDMQYNRGETDDGAREVCAHLAYVSTVHPQLSTDEMALYKSMALMEQGATLRDQLDTQLDRFEQALVELRDANAGVQAEPDSQATESGSQASSDASSVANASDKADELQAAYDDVVEDMQVQSHEGYVWVQTGQDTPDELGGPGNVSVFDAFLKNPEQVEFIHDDHDDVSQKPGEWWKNRINPDDVDEYINEVLQ